MADTLETYLTELREIRASNAAVKETSGYGTLANLINAVGDSLKPKVRCVIQLKNSGAGLPDGGLFTPDQLKKTDEQAPLHGIPQPARGVIEVKGTAEDLADLCATAQVKEYLAHYGQVLLTNYRDFLLLKRGPGGAMQRLEGFRLADSEAAFWAAAAHPRKAAAALGERFTEYLKRVLLHAAPLNNPRDVAFFLASYARDARARVEAAGDLPALTAVRTALEEALGMKFDAQRGEHFFRSTLVQTIFYGVFSAWVLWHKANPARRDAFDWRAAAWTLHVPMIKALFDQVATPTRLGPLGLVEVLDWTAAALNRVDRPAFYERFVETHAVQYFYEPFLEAFDPALRKELGVWYTPPEVVEYMVARVDTALREELGILNGLADPRVFVLDPCCGTGAYLVEVLRRIARTLQEEQGEESLAGAAMKEAAMSRVFGFEIMPAPFVVAHLQMGLVLQGLGVPLNDAKNERAGIYLTNSLTGWEPPGEEAKKQLTFAIPEFQQEKAAADEIKQEKRIIVILGNPPYNGFAGVAVEEERDLSTAYRTTKHAPAPQGQGLNDLYVRFFRMAERRIVEKSGAGIVCFISNYSWLDGLSFTGMRERYLEVFDGITIDCLNGDKYKTGKLTPDGQPDPSVFSTGQNREGIQVGTAIATLVRKPEHKAGNGVQFRHLWGKEKRVELLASLSQTKKKIYDTLKPPVQVGLPFAVFVAGKHFNEWPSIDELLAYSSFGFLTNRDEALVSIDREPLVARMTRYFDPQISNAEIAAEAPALMRETGRFHPTLTRSHLLARGRDSGEFVRLLYRPFDVRWLYWHAQTKLIEERREEFRPHIFPGNLVLAVVRHNRKGFTKPLVASVFPSHHLIERGANYFPLCFRASADPQSSRVRETPDMFGGGAGGGGGEEVRPNLTPAASAYLSKLGAEPEALFFHIVAVLHAPGYGAENAGALRQDWPRVPLPKSRAALLASAELGRQVAALLDTETPVTDVDNGTVRDELKAIAIFSSPKNQEIDFEVTAGWGHAGQGGVTMPGRGKVATRDCTAAERAALADGAAALGPGTHDVFLNEAACWRNVPERVWDFTIGGYQVLKKWLSYRERPLLGRALTPDEARHFTHTARRLAALLLLQPALDKNYDTVKSAAASWSGSGTGAR